MKNFYSIGETAKINDVSVQALRLYERMSLLHPAYIDKDNGYRYYSEHQFIYLDIIRYSKSIGLPLKKLMNIFETENVEELKKLLTQQVDFVNQKKQSLERIEKDLYRLLGQLEDFQSTPILEVIEKEFEDRSILIKSISSEYNLQTLDLENREFEMELKRKKIRLGNGYGQLFEYSSDHKIDFSYHFIEVDKKTRKKEVFESGLYLSVLFDKEPLITIVELIQEYAKKKNFFLSPTFIVYQHIGTSFFEIYELQVKCSK